MRDHGHDAVRQTRTPTQATVWNAKASRLRGTRMSADGQFGDDLGRDCKIRNGASSPPTASTFSSYFPPYRRPMPDRLIRPDSVILGTAAALLGVALACGLIVPPLFGFLLMASVVVSVVFLSLCFPTEFCVVWLLITSMTLEMALHDLVGEDAFQPAIAVIKGVEIGLGFLCMVRFGPRGDPLCPAWAFLAMTAVGLAMACTWDNGSGSLRSMIGSIAPFVFCFVRVPRPWAEAIIRTTKWCPLVAVVAAAVGRTDIRPLSVESGGARLAGLGHPAFLANVCLPAIYACLIQLYREGRRGDLLLLIVNFLILVLTGARGPAAYAVAVTVISLISIRSRVFRARYGSC